MKPTCPSSLTELRCAACAGPFLSLRQSPAALLSSVPAAANGRFPASNQIVFSPCDDNLIVLRTSYGILPSHDNGATWAFVCEDALDLPSGVPEDPSVGLTTNNSLIAGVPVGLNVSRDDGCNWSCIQGGLQSQVVADIAVRPDNPASAVAITGSYLQTDAAQENIYSQVFETTDNGVTWTAIGTPIDPAVTVTTIDVARTDPNRLYVSGTRGFGSLKTASLFVSTNKGASWTEQALPAAEFDPTTEDGIYIGAIDPTNADRVYVRSAGLQTGGRSRLTVFTRTPTPAFSTADVFDVEAGFAGEATGELLGFALSPDGSKIYIGTKEEGLWVAATSDMKFTKKSSIVVQCLATRGSELWACSAEVNGFVAGVSTDDGATFTPKLPLLGALTGPIACAENANGAACSTTENSSQCGPAYAMFCAYYGCGEPEGGTGDEEGAPPPARSSSQCDVSLLGGGGGAMLAGAVALCGIALQRRRTRR